MSNTSNMTIREILLQKGTVSALIDKTDDVLTNCKSCKSIHRKAMMKEKNEIFSALRRARDILGDLWVRPFTLMEDRRQLTDIANDIVNAKLATKDELIPIEENVLLHILVDRMKCMLPVVEQLCR
jgi:hypothetical protein